MVLELGIELGEGRVDGADLLSRMLMGLGLFIGWGKQYLDIIRGCEVEHGIDGPINIKSHEVFMLTRRIVVKQLAKSLVDGKT